MLELHSTQNDKNITMHYAVLSEESPPGDAVVRSENDAYQLACSLYVSYFVFVADFSS